MKKYIIRLDDASEYMDLKKWEQMEKLLDKYAIKPIFGIIPKNGDTSLVSIYKKNAHFWELVNSWIDKGWIPAMHGYEHKYITQEGGINPVNKRSEFAGLSYEEQAKKIRNGWSVLLEHGIKPDIFFAPSHTFDENTILALKNETNIRIISDTLAWDVYCKNTIFFIPQQSGYVRKLPFKTCTFCYHPNKMNDKEFLKLENFIIHNLLFFSTLDKNLITREKTFLDTVLQKTYFAYKKIRRLCSIIFNREYLV